MITNKAQSIENKAAKKNQCKKRHFFKKNHSSIKANHINLLVSQTTDL